MHYVDIEKSISFKDFAEQKQMKSSLLKSYGITYNYQAVTFVYLIFSKLQENGITCPNNDFVDYKEIENKLFLVVKNTLDEDFRQVSLITSCNNNWDSLDMFEKLDNLIISEINAIKYLNLAIQQNRNDIVANIYEDNLLFCRLEKPKYKAKDKNKVNTIFDLSENEFEKFIENKFSLFKTEFCGNENHLIDEYISYLSDLDISLGMDYDDIIRYYDDKPYYDPEEFSKTDLAVYHSRLMCHILGKRKVEISIDLLLDFFKRLQTNGITKISKNSSFNYNKEDERTRKENITNLLNSLKKNKFVHVDTKIGNFKKLFNLKGVDDKIIWLKYKNELAFFIKSIIDLESIEYEKDTHWDITVESFSNKKGESYIKDDLRNAHKPASAKKIKQIIKLL